MSFKFKTYSEDVSSKIDIASATSLRRIGTRLTSDIRSVSPVDTGELKRSIGYQVHQDNVEIGTANKYASSIELGTSKKKAKPFITNTVNERHKEIRKIIERTIRSISKM